MECVTECSASGCGCATITGILKKIKRDGPDRKAVVVVVEGGLYEHCLFHTYLQTRVKEMLSGRRCGYRELD